MDNNLAYMKPAVIQPIQMMWTFVIFKRGLQKLAIN